MKISAQSVYDPIKAFMEQVIGDELSVFRLWWHFIEFSPLWVGGVWTRDGDAATFCSDLSTNSPSKPLEVALCFSRSTGQGRAHFILSHILT